MTQQIVDSVQLRRLSLFDLDEFARHLLRLDPQGRRLRFGMVASDTFLRSYAQASARWGVVLHGYFADGVLRGVAELRPLPGKAGQEAELAFSIETGWRGRGIGGELFAKLLRTARNRGYRRLHMSCLASNEPMQALARKFGATFVIESGGAAGTLDPRYATPGSVIAEAADEAAAFVFSTIRLPGINPLRRLFAPGIAA